MRARAWMTASALVASTQLWCSSNDDARLLPADAGAETGASVDAAADARAPADRCSDSFCRVAVDGIDGVSLNAVWAKSVSEVWFVGNAGFAARFDGATFTRVETGVKATLLGVTGTRSGAIWGASSGDSFLRLDRAVDGGVEKVDGGFSGLAFGIAAFGDDVYAVGTMLPGVGLPPPPSYTIWRHRSEWSDGPAEWRPFSPPCPSPSVGEPVCQWLRAVWVESSGRPWFVGDDGKVFRGSADGEPTAITEMNSGSLRRLNAVWGSSGTDIWAVGVHGVIRHFASGDAWTEVASPTSEDLYGVWGSRSDDVWAVGDHGAVLHWDGQRWAVTDIPFSTESLPRFYAVGGSGADVWIAGESVLLRSAHAAARDR